MVLLKTPICSTKQKMHTYIPAPGCPPPTSLPPSSYFQDSTPLSREPPEGVFTAEAASADHHHLPPFATHQSKPTRIIVFCPPQRHQSETKLQRRIGTQVFLDILRVISWQGYFCTGSVVCQDRNNYTRHHTKEE